MKRFLRSGVPFWPLQSTQPVGMLATLPDHMRRGPDGPTDVGLMAVVWTLPSGNLNPPLVARMIPATSSGAPGEVVPMPTLVPLSKIAPVPSVDASVHRAAMLAVPVMAET